MLDDKDITRAHFFMQVDEFIDSLSSKRKLTQKKKSNNIHIVGLYYVCSRPTNSSSAAHGSRREPRSGGLKLWAPAQVLSRPKASGNDIYRSDTFRSRRRTLLKEKNIWTLWCSVLEAKGIRRVWGLSPRINGRRVLYIHSRCHSYYLMYVSTFLYVDYMICMKFSTSNVDFSYNIMIYTCSTFKYSRTLCYRTSRCWLLVIFRLRSQHGSRGTYERCTSGYQLIMINLDSMARTEIIDRCTMRMHQTPPQL